MGVFLLANHLKSVVCCRTDGKEGPTRGENKEE